MSFPSRHPTEPNYALIANVDRRRKVESVDWSDVGDDVIRDVFNLVTA